MIYSIGKRIKNFVKVRIYQFEKKTGADINSFEDGSAGGYSGSYNTNGANSSVELKKYFYDNGRLKAEAFYKDGKLDGIANYYYETGDLKAREYYKNNQLQGLSRWYYESGEVKSERYYQEGNLVSRKEFDKTGRIIRTSTTD